MDITLAQASLVPLVLALTEVVKRVGVSAKWLPGVSIVLGIGIVWATTLNLDWLGGIIVGLSASGLWSSAKNTLK